MFMFVFIHSIILISEFVIVLLISCDGSEQVSIKMI